MRALQSTLHAVHHAKHTASRTHSTTQHVVSTPCKRGTAHHAGHARRIAHSSPHSSKPTATALPTGGAAHARAGPLCPRRGLSLPHAALPAWDAGCVSAHCLLAVGLRFPAVHEPKCPLCFQGRWLREQSCPAGRGHNPLLGTGKCSSNGEQKAGGDTGWKTGGGSGCWWS